jgi:hypothetical protein
LVGLPEDAAITTPQAMAAAGDAVTRLDLVFRAPAKAASEPAAGRELAFSPSADDIPYHGFFPAAWPVAPASERGFTWAVTCRGGGLASFRLQLRLDRTGPFSVTEVSVQALSFYNGQVTSDKPRADFVQAIEPGSGQSERDLAVTCADFGLAAPAPGSKSAYLLLIRIGLRIPEAGELEITPTLHPDATDGADGPALSLPGLRLAVTRPAWMPLVADRPAATRQQPVDPQQLQGLARTLQEARLQVSDLVLCLNAPALHTAVAMVPEDRAEPAPAVLMAQLVALMAPTGLLATVKTQKHMTPSFSVPKSSQTVPLEALADSALWRKLFDPESNYQTIRIGIAPPDAPFPLAGLVLQGSLRLGRRSGLGDPTRSLAFWAVAAPAALARLSLDITAALSAFTDWVRTAAPRQGWIADCAWFPEFSCYEDFRGTPYEALARAQWGHEEITALAANPSRLKACLRFVAPTLWLDQDLAQQVDPTALDEVATVSSFGPTVEVRLRERTELRRLEQALAPLLLLRT